MSQKVPSIISSIVSCKCPRCREGKVFPHSAFNLFGFSKTNDHCPNCGLKFEHQTGFFWGAMYISYAFGTIIMIVFGVLAINLDWSFAKIAAVLVPTMLLITPFSYRYSRILLLYLLSPNRHFDKKYG